MHFLNLSLGQFLATFGAVATVSIALYLLDRSRRRQVVSTLRFWVAAEQPSVVARRRRIQQPWSLLLQLISMGLLLLALAEVRFGTPGPSGRDHVLILDTSAWMAANLAATGRSGGRALIDLARQRALQYVRALPAIDRVMLVRADALATPATAFEPDRRKVETAIQDSRPGSTALNLDQALAFARRVQAQAGGHAGEIALISTGHIAEPDSANTASLPRNLRFIPIADPIENAGLRKIGMRRSNEDPDLWEIYVSARNYGSRPRLVTLAIDFGPPNEATRIVAGTRRIRLEPGAEGEETFQLRTRAAGILGVTLSPRDAFPDDDKAALQLPAQPNLAVTVYSENPEALRPILAANPRVSTVYKKPAEYQPASSGLIVLDRFRPPQRPEADSIWIDPPAAGSPIPVSRTVEQAAFSGWNTTSPTAAGLRANDFKLEKASVFEAAPGDIRIGEVEAGPVIVARPDKPKLVVFGFHPAFSAMRYEIATPLLFANLLRWFAPEIFRRWELTGGSVGAVKLDFEEDLSPANVKVTAEDGSALPFVLRGRALHFFSGSPGLVRVAAGDREYIYSQTLPQLWDTKWEPPAEVRRGIPRPSPFVPQSAGLWPWLAVFGGIGLLAEWLLFGRFRRAGRLSEFRFRAATAGGARRPALNGRGAVREKEVVHR
ncbi:MAG: BatA and WFA domain-containing protein [Acidobacteriia bacterium]|nr:BatA and WFA domain-containing protein [Terriglobia bacterium]